MPIVQKQHYNKIEFPLLLTHYFGTPKFIVQQWTDQKQKYFLVLPSVLWVFIQKSIFKLLCKNKANLANSSSQDCFL